MRRLALIPILVLVAASCSSSSELKIDDAWARNSAGLAEAGAVYMTITGGGEADRLTSATVDAGVAGMAQIHETSMDDDGLMSMQQISQLDIPADGEVNLEPGGFHVMIMPLTEPLTAGDEFIVALNFEKAGLIDVTIEVRDE